MKIDFIFISIILVIISFLPFILFPLLKLKKEKTLKNKFKEEAISLGLNMSFELAWNTNLAGIDILKREFLFVQHLNDQFLIQRVNLKKVHNIKLVVENKQVENQEKKNETLSRVTLEFYENNLAEPLSVTLFDSDQNFTQDFELKNSKALMVELEKYVSALPVLKRTA